MNGSGLPELFYGGFHAGARGPDIVEKDIGGGWINGDARVDSVGVFGLGDSGVVIGADLSGAIGA